MVRFSLILPVPRELVKMVLNAGTKRTKTHLRLSSDVVFLKSFLFCRGFKWSNEGNLTLFKHTSLIPMLKILLSVISDREFERCFTIPDLGIVFVPELIFAVEVSI